jgi:hypothetical protein
MSMAEARELTGAGAALLDQLEPVLGGELSNWREKIQVAVDEDDLDIGRSDSCVLGHLFGSYDAGRVAIFGDDDTDPSAYGLCSLEYTSNRELELAWRELVG